MGMRVTPADFQRLNLRCHTLLSDVPLHDVWAIPLDGGGAGRNIQDARATLFGDRRPSSNFAVRGLFALRWTLGRLFGWDDERHYPLSVSYVNRLAEADRTQSRVPPGPAMVAFECCTSSTTKPSASFATRPCTPSCRWLSRHGPGIHALHGHLCEAREPFHHVLHGLDRPFRRLIVYPALGTHVSNVGRVPMRRRES